MKLYTTTFHTALQKVIYAVVAGAVLMSGTLLGAQFASAQEAPAGEASPELERKEHLTRTLTNLGIQVKELRAQLHAKRSDNKAEYEDLRNTRQILRKQERYQDKAAFMESIKDLPKEERRTAMQEYIADLKADIATRKAKWEAARTQRQNDKAADREAFKKSLEGLTQEQKLAAIKARLVEMQALADARGEKIADTKSQLPSVDGKYTVDNVDVVNIEVVPDSVAGLDQGYTEHTIVLKDGTSHVVKQLHFGTVQMFHEDIRNTGYVGNINKLLKLIVNSVDDVNTTN